jgi:hypothetical protein
LPFLRDAGQDRGNPAEDLIDTLGDHGVHGLVDVEGVGNLRAVVRRGSRMIAVTTSPETVITRRSCSDTSS